MFCFFVTICEINAYLAYAYFIWNKNPKGFTKPTVHQFRRTLAIELIYNSFLEDKVTCGVENRKRRRTTDHELVAVPKHTKRYRCGKWEKCINLHFSLFSNKNIEQKRYKIYIPNLVFGSLVCGVQSHRVLEVLESSFPVVEGKVGFALAEPGLGTVLVLLDYLSKDKL